MSTPLQSLSIAERFLQAAVLIDDELVWPTASELEGEVEILEPGEFDPVAENAGASEAANSSIDPNQLVAGFSAKGLICATYLWTEGQGNFPNSTDSADLLILDWKLSKTENPGDAAKKFLSERLKHDLSVERRLRHITIYTDRPKGTVLDGVVECLGHHDGVCVNKVEEGIDLSIEDGAKLWRILHLSKDDVQESELADRIVSDFAEFASGLLPGVVMAAVSELKARTFEYLYRYSAHLDGAALSHYLSLVSGTESFASAHDDFEDYIASLIVSEMSDSIHGSIGVSNALSIDRLKEIAGSWDAIKIGNETAETDKMETALSLFGCETREEFETAAKEIKEGKNFLRKGLQVRSSAKDSFETFATRDLLNHHPRTVDDQFQLKSGTIVKRTGMRGGPQYFVCVQPLCDGVRLTEITPFPFLKLSVLDAKSFTYVVNDPKPVYLGCRFTPSDIEMVRFKPNTSSADVRTKSTRIRNKPKKAFISKQNTKFVWVGQLKEIYALELQSRLAEQGGRIGSNKFEWLRRKGK